MSALSLVSHREDLVGVGKQATSAAFSALLISSTTAQLWLASASVVALSIGLAPTPALAVTCVTGIATGETAVVNSVATTNANALTGVNTTSTTGQALTGVNTTSTSGQALTGVNTTSTSDQALTGITATTTSGTALTGVTPTTADAVTSVGITTTADTGMKPRTFTTLIGLPAGTHIWHEATPSPTPPLLRDYTWSGMGYTGGEFAAYTPTQFLTSATPTTGTNPFIATLTRTTGSFLTDVSTTATSAYFLTGVNTTSTSAAFLTGVNTTSTSADFLTGVNTTSTNAAFVNSVTPGFTNVVNSVAAQSSGATSVGNSLGCGPGATAADGGTAVGPQATAGANATAIGLGATANFVGSTAIGAGASTTAPNQIMLGTAANTYRAPGITSDASRAAQGAPTAIVTTNDAGDLAAHTPAELNLARTSDISRLQTEINRLGRRDDELADGIAIAVAMAQPMFQPGQAFAMRAGWGNFEGSNAVSFTAAGVLSRGNFGRLSTVVLDAGIATSTSESVTAGRGGVTLGW